MQLGGRSHPDLRGKPGEEVGLGRRRLVGLGVRGLVWECQV